VDDGQVRGPAPEQHETPLAPLLDFARDRYNEARPAREPVDPAAVGGEDILA
jgi:hypothetical protein